MGQPLDTYSDLPEFFITDVRVEMLPGRCVRAVYLHPIHGEVCAVIIPLQCWLECRMKFVKFLTEQGEPAQPEVYRLAH